MPTKNARKVAAERARLFRSLSHPMRCEILDLADHPTSPKEMALVLDVPIENLSYHVRCLRDDGMLRLVKTRPVRGTIERFYTTTPDGRRAMTVAKRWAP